MQGSKIVVGILAHVDAGKTTLSEGLLYTAGVLRKLGRVDHRDSFLDNFALERERGITIFSKQANLSWKGLELVLLDTPGHVDFSAETERTLQVLDYCLLVVSGPDGVQGHTETLWRLLKKYEIPVFLFINKMDQPGTDRQALMREIQGRLGSECVEFGEDPDRFEDLARRENLAVCCEALLEEYLETGRMSDESVAKAVAKRQVFPCYFGSALHLEGIEELLEGLRRFTVDKEYPNEFGARVYKISRDAAGNRLTHLKVTGGELRVKMPVSNGASALDPGDVWEEKADILRIYDGGGFRTVDRVEAGEICAVTGLSRTFAGQGLGCEGVSGQPVLEPVLTYRLVLPEGTDAVKALEQLRRLEEETPEIHVVWRESIREIHLQVMGEVQTEVLRSLIQQRFGMEVSFDSGRLLYRETIASPAEGIGHFEPLRHYAEVHLLLEPGEPGSGLEFTTKCSEDELDRNWQRLVLTHLEEKTHPGVLTGSPITDMKITLLSGRAHLKHTEGGDFRQATYRALRQGLMQCESVLLEPVFSFVLEVPLEQMGRAMSDIRRMCGSFEPPVTQGNTAVFTGSAPVATMRDYQREVNAYTKGRGRLACVLKGYEPCHNEAEVVESIGYDAEADTENPSASVFCAHGAGFLVGWKEVPTYAHIESGWSREQPEGGGEKPDMGRTGRQESAKEGRSDYITQEEIEEIFQRTYGKSPQSYAPYRYHRQNTGGTGQRQPEEETQADSGGEGAPGRSAAAGRDGKYGGKRLSGRPEEYFQEVILVDGYNIIFAWEELRSLAEVNIDSARDRLMDICCNFQGYSGATLILVYDAYKVKGNPGSVQRYHNIYVVYTKEAETADQYIEKTVHKIGKKYRVTVATSDALEQMIIWGEGAVRLSAKGFYEAVQEAGRRIREEHQEGRKLSHRINIPEQ
ncbi:MAG: TetM/TetW/TetO/TetS family tetracycline resistance ribosomal protection protein [Firmicutes bacterium]|nr:TetM/TetW/TetO/TetS family tetracycline resistance ribosomal protection protein [Bacillota bacterium]